jgi:hypothetical protein
MFEIVILCVIFLAAAYWAVLWLMGRREDVLHGAAELRSVMRPFVRPNATAPR